MIYMLFFWLVLLLAGILYLLLRKFRARKADEITLYVILFAIAVLVVAIVTKDPLFSSFGVPPEFEWIVGLFITALSSWKLYFSPLKERVMKTEREIGSMQADVSSIKSDVTLIKEKIIKIISNHFNTRNASGH